MQAVPQLVLARAQRACMSHIHVAAEEGGQPMPRLGHTGLKKLFLKVPGREQAAVRLLTCHVNLPVNNLRRESQMLTHSGAPASLPGLGRGQFQGAPPRSRDRAVGPSARQHLDRVFSQSIRQAMLHGEEETWGVPTAHTDHLSLGV